MLPPWGSASKIKDWSHRLILIPQHQALLDCAGVTGNNPKDAKKIAQQGVKWMLKAAKNLAKDPQIAHALANLRFADLMAQTYPPTTAAIVEIELKTMQHSPMFDPLFSIVIDLKPTLGLNPQKVKNLAEEEKFWNMRRLFVSHISTAIASGEGVKYILVAYDPLADEEVRDEMDVVKAIKPRLIKQLIENGEYTAGFYNTMHPRNTLEDDSDEENSLLRQYLTRLDHGIHL